MGDKKSNQDHASFGHLQRKNKQMLLKLKWNNATLKAKDSKIKVLKKKLES